MKSQKDRACLSLLLIFIGLLGSGCETIISGAFESLDYNMRVDSYRDSGYSKREAKQKASDDLLIKKIDENQ
jgi:hypothetical protein